MVGLAGMGDPANPLPMWLWQIHSKKPRANDYIIGRL